MSSSMIAPMFSLALVLTLTLLNTTPTASVPEDFIYGGCSRINFVFGSPYQYALNYILTSVADSAALYPYNHFSVASPDSHGAPLSAIYQCRGNIDSAACADCIRRCTSQLSSYLCPAAAGAVLQLNDCYLKYNNASSLVGAPDKSLMANKCGPVPYTHPGKMSRRDEVLQQLAAGTELHSEGEAAGVRGEAQCVGDLSASDCRDCVSFAGATLRRVCSVSAWGEVYLGKCWVRLTESSEYQTPTSSLSPPASHNSSSTTGKVITATIVIIFGLLALGGLIFIFIKYRKNMAGFLKKKFSKKFTKAPKEATGRMAPKAAVPVETKVDVKAVPVETKAIPAKTTDKETNAIPAKPNDKAVPAKKTNKEVSGKK